MNPDITPPYPLEKSIWTEADFHLMGWHDSFIHAFAFRPESFELLLDIDYILKWVEPGGDQYFSFWVAPATLVFWNVSDLEIDLAPITGIEVLDIARESAGPPRNAAHIGVAEEWRWTIDCTAGEITLRSAGYSQYFRKMPRLQRQQALSLAERGGYSFERPDTHTG
jgi:hypothetical protein